MRTTKELEFTFPVERPLPPGVVIDDDTIEVILKVSATAVPADMSRERPGTPAELDISDMTITGPDGEEFAVTEGERARILDSAHEAAVGAFEDPRY